MKKVLLLLATFIAMLSVEAAPALRGPFTVKQADGTLLTIEQFGDEYHHWTSTTDGTMIINTGKGYFVADIDENGELKATDVLAHETNLRTNKELALIQKQATRRALFHQRGQQANKNRALSIGTAIKYLPHKGNVRILTILAEYQDVKFTVNQPVKAFDQLLNGDTQEDLGNENTLNIGSVRQYFEASSRGQFSPEFDIVGPVTLPDSMKVYGGTNSNGYDDKFSTFCTDALNQVKEGNLVSDWSVYDNDKDNVVELICIIFAGYGQNQGGANNTIWAKAGFQNIKIDNTYRVSFFNCSCEKFHPQEAWKDYINGIGVFNHEMSHCMGLPDLYVTSSGTYVNNQGMEKWDIMDYGLYNRNGFAPSLYTAWEQEVMGWTEIEPLSQNSTISGMTTLQDGGKAYKIANSDNEREFIVMENIQKSGLNSYSAGHGLLVYHVAYPNASVNYTNSPNNTRGRPAVAVVPANGLLINSYLRGDGKPYTNNEWTASIAASIFPGTGNVTTLCDAMELPNYLFYVGDNDSKPIGLGLTDITETDGMISFRLYKPGDVNGDTEINITDITNVIDKINNQPSAEFDEKAADLNNDGEINITDVTLILDIINQKNN